MKRPLAAVAAFISSRRLVLAQPAGEATLTSWPIRCSKDCNGRNTCEEICRGESQQTHACADQPECPISSLCPKGTEPQDCEFSAWTAWSKDTDCTGLCHRERNITKPNRCGGKPCDGPLTTTKTCEMAPRCHVEPQDCQLADWQDWSQCGARMRCQRDRQRAVRVPEQHGGRVCEGALAETEVCGEDCNTPVHCTTSRWMEWSSCTKPCGGGERTRLRTIITRAENGGRPCTAPLSEKEGCNTQACEDETSVDCQLSQWSRWTTCATGGQKMRQRSIDARPQGAGKVCEAELEETAGCGSRAALVPAACQMSDWSAWQLCDKTCDGGQTFRTRSLLNDTASCRGLAENFITVETGPCNTHACSLDKEPCRVSAWTAWGECSTTCGAGQQQRTRTIIAEAQKGGVACDLPLVDTQACPGERGACATVDCEWDFWQDWSECSKSCGGSGQRNRSKTVRQPASRGGQACADGPTEEVEACGLQPCHVEVCVNGEWGPWGDWTRCSKSCRGGFRWHSRRVAVEANHCGDPPLGQATEAESCNDDVVCHEDVDCEFSEWTDWSQCSSKCTGTRSRDRKLTRSAAGDGLCGSGKGPEAIEEVASCVGAQDGTEECGNAAPTNCTFHAWRDWAECSASCGGGQTVRTRQAGSPDNSFTFGRRLGTVAFNCSQGAENWDWGWSKAKKAYCCRETGIACEDGGAGEEEEEAKLDNGYMCDGPLMVTKPCNTLECNVQAVDCEYEEWADWSLCTGCDGTRVRQRGIAQDAQHGGRVCQMKESEQVQQCPRTCGEKLYYCVWGNWSEPSDCSASCGEATRKRVRKMVLTEEKPEDPLAVASSAEQCAGQLVDVVPCPDNPTCAEVCEQEDCLLGDWSEWGPPTCEGLCWRHRNISQLNSECGRPCAGALNATKPCPADCSSKDCVLSEWSPFTECTSELDQKYAYRTILQEPAFNGMGCVGMLNKTGSCMTGTEAPQNCELGEWADWSECDSDCSGQSVRARTVSAEATKGGSPCEGALKLTRSCNAHCIGGGESSGGVAAAAAAGDAKPQDCIYTAWSLWTQCEGEADEQIYRTRYIMKVASAGGQPCQGRTRETKKCGEELDKNSDCVFSAWSPWSGCPVSCGGGQYTRSRNIQVHARGGGKRCAGPLVEAETCGSEACPGAVPSTACKVSDWKPWSDCSASCGTGFKTRSRKFLEPALAGTENCDESLKEADSCQIKPCGNATDCAWGNWAPWSDCVPAPDVCGIGYKRRSRRIETLPKDGGALCVPRVRDQVMPVADCRGQPQCCINGQWGDWESWGACSATCGKGTRKRDRQLAVKETWCGETAAGPATEFDGCEADGCSDDQDCEFADWQPWSACSSTCHGNRTRHREIKVHAMGVGKSCAGVMRSVERCNPADGQAEPWSCEAHPSAPTGPQDCLMAEWSEWGKCSSTCQGGYQMRERHIQVHPEMGGKSCPSELKQIQGCMADTPCFPGRVDCKWEHWTAWSECNNLLFKFRTRGVKEHEAGGGVACDGDVRQIEPCSGPGTGVDSGASCVEETYTCSWGNWSAWTECSSTCGTGGIRSRTKTLKVSDQPAPVSHEMGVRQQKFELEARLGAKIRALEEGRGREVAQAFALGFLSLSAAVGLVKVARLFGTKSAARRPEPRSMQYDVVPQHPL